MCKVNTTRLLSALLLINTGLCGICERAFLGTQNKVDKKKLGMGGWVGGDVQMGRFFFHSLEENIVTGSDKTSVERRLAVDKYMKSIKCLQREAKCTLRLLSVPRILFLLEESTPDVIPYIEA